MPLGNRVKSDALSTVYTDQVYALGTTYVQLADEVDEGDSGVDSATSFDLLQGERTWIFVKASAAITAGQIVKRNAAGTPFEVTPSTAATNKLNLAGVADHDIASGSYGWIIARGACVADAATVAAGNLLAAAASGEVTAITPAGGTSGNVVGVALEAKSGTFTNFAQVVIDLL